MIRRNCVLLLLLVLLTSIRLGAAAMEKPLIVLTDSTMLNHKTSEIENAFPENPTRLEQIADAIVKKSFAVLSPAFSYLEENRALKAIKLVHEQNLASQLRIASRSLNGGEVEFLKDAESKSNADLPMSSGTYDAAICAVNSALTGVDLVMQGTYRSVFAAIRPPGHHASSIRQNGFCFFNNIAIAARYAQKTYKIKKVLIFDWDVHHGDGTQEIFFQDPDVLFVSIHQYGDFYPMTGKEIEVGSGKGIGFTINVPLPKGSGDAEYVAALKALQKNLIDFNPELILISAGFDGNQFDPIGGMNLTPEGYFQMTEIIKEVHYNSDSRGIVSFLEGGYEIDGKKGGMVDSVLSHLNSLKDITVL